jgi:hypothetical protein
MLLSLPCQGNKHFRKGKKIDTRKQKKAGRTSLAAKPALLDIGIQGRLKEELEDRNEVRVGFCAGASLV